MTKYIFITGGVLSSLGKGIAAASIGALLKSRGFKVRNRKMDPYLNVDPGTLSPFQHGEVFVTDDGAETDLDLGHYERFTDTLGQRTDSISGGRIFWNVLTKERAGFYDGRNVQLIPEVTDEVKAFLASDIHDEDFIIYEVGGTIGDMEGFIFVEGVRQFINMVGRENAMLVHLTYVPYLKTSQEVKTKPTQQSVKLLLEDGLSPNIILCRSDNPIPQAEKNKIAMFCNVAPADVISAPDVDNIYKIPNIYHREGLDERVLSYFGMLKDAKKPDMKKWESIENTLAGLKRAVTIAVVAKYSGLPDAYKSLLEALAHAGLANDAKVSVKWVNAEHLEKMSDSEVAAEFGDIDGMIVPGGFGSRGIEGKIKAAGYARTHDVPYLGICLGMQVAVIEMARNLLGIKNANSTEFDKKCTPIIYFINEWEHNGKKETRVEGNDIGGTLRLGAYPCKIAKGT
ncbi:MAG: CTP synthase, partial [Rickettsiales bacterium]|nr:CTP synthase [Rickettsiales bacterium]